MYFVQRIIYYLTSFVTLVRGVRNWPVLFRLRGQEATKPSWNCGMERNSLFVA